MTTFTRSELDASCNICLLAEAMKDCQACKFKKEETMVRATSEDIFRMWKRLWGDATMEQVQAITYFEFDNESAKLAKEKRDENMGIHIL